jgi:molecular chaperone DnaK (HSP70)
MTDTQKVYGIDLGTTYSCIAHVDEHGKPVVVDNAEGSSTTPSVVYFETADNIVVGQPAKEVAGLYPDQVVSTVKRAMGDPHWIRDLFGSSYTPQDVSSFILRKVVGDAEQITGDQIKDVVITCPAYFGINEKEATKQAGQLAGLNVLYVIPEPTAAALAYGMEQDEDQVVLVYDLGGGTFDVTVIEVSGSDITVVCTGGDHELGGKDWDDAVVDYLTQTFETETGISADSLAEDAETYQELLNDAEAIKKSLSSRESVVRPVRFDGQRVKVEITRERFDELTSPLLGRTLDLTDQVMEKARAKGIETVDRVLLVGGSTYMPQVKTAVEGRFDAPVELYDPNQAVAKGAAIYGFKCQLDVQIRLHVAEALGAAADEIDLDEVADEVVEAAHEEVARRQDVALSTVRELAKKKVTNVSSKSFGIVALDAESQERVFNLVQVDEPVPKVETQQFYTSAEGQTRVDLRCMENLVADSQVELGDSRPVGEAVLEFAQALPQSSPVEITFDLGPDGLLRLHGRDLTTHREVDALFETEAILSREEVEEARSRNLTISVS